jgi:Secretion system C-terminal sorting domain
MKHTIIYMSLLFFLINDSAYGQCLSNGNFATYCGTQVYYSNCPTFNSPCLANWKRSHGTPQIFCNPGNPVCSFNSAFMWADATKGEGLFAEYNFLLNHTYIVTVIAAANGATGNFRVYAANGLTETAPLTCGTPIPSINTKQLIMQRSPVLDQTWQTFIISFTPNANYNQLWIYPTSTGGNYNFSVASVDVCPDCTGFLVYNNGIVPVGNSKAGYIYAGSSAGSGGSGTVTISPSATTDLLAVNTIYLQQEFRASVTTGTFTAKITNCDNAGTLQAIYNPKPVDENNQVKNINPIPVYKPLGVNTDSLNWLARINKLPMLEENNITIFPIPSKGKIKITGSQVDLANAKIVVVDQSGKEVYRLLNKAGNTIPELDLHFLQNGVYYIKISSQNKVTTKKVIINK